MCVHRLCIALLFICSTTHPAYTPENAIIAFDINNVLVKTARPKWAGSSIAYDETPFIFKAMWRLWAL